MASETTLIDQMRADAMSLLYLRISGIIQEQRLGHTQMARDHFTRCPSLAIRAFGMQDINTHERVALRRAFEAARENHTDIVATSPRDALIELSGTFDINVLAENMLWR